LVAARGRLRLPPTVPDRRGGPAGTAMQDPLDDASDAGMAITPLPAVDAAPVNQCAVVAAARNRGARTRVASRLAPDGEWALGLDTVQLALHGDPRPREVLVHILASVRRSTLEVYSRNFRVFQHWCESREPARDAFAPGEENLVAYLSGGATGSAASLRPMASGVGFHLWLRHSTTPWVSASDSVQRVLRGAANLRPVLPTRTGCWDPGAVLAFWGAQEDASLRDTSIRCALYLALCTSWRPRSDLGRILWSSVAFEGPEDGPPVSVSFTAWLPKEGPQKSITLEAFEEPTLCPVRALRRYVDVTRGLRQETDPGSYLFISTIAPYGEAKEDTIARWVTDGLLRAGIVATAHTTRAASASRAVTLGAPLDQVLRSANWASVKTFTRHYQRHVRRGHDALETAQVADSILRDAKRRRLSPAVPSEGTNPHY
jgi:hypothetical protein